MAITWDPDRYLAFADERGRPFVDLLARVRTYDPRRVVDLGCGTGNQTVLLARRWPRAHVLGVDSSREMIAGAPVGGGVEFTVGDLTLWRPQAPVDVLVCNAVFQWVPGHLDLLPALGRWVAPGGWFAFQVPGNLAEPSHTAYAELAAQAPYAEHLIDVETPFAHDPATYLAALRAEGFEVDAWETTYLHPLTGADPVFTWVSGTAVRPLVQALPGDLRHQFETELKDRLRTAYPAEDGVVVLPFRRVFVVARKPPLEEPAGG